MYKLFWLAGENSGDIHASYVMDKIKLLGIPCQHYGIGGYHMQSKGLKALYPFKQFNVMGFFEVIKHLDFFRKVENEIKKQLTDNPPDIVILIDYPGLNLRIAKIAKNLGIPVFYYICPQFWAWKHHRVKLLAEYTDFVASILPFETDLMNIHRIDSAYVGHPIVEEISVKINREEFAKINGLDMNKRWISFFPGSREDEVEKLLPIYLNTIRLFDPNEYQFMISKASTINERSFLEIVATTSLPRHEVKLISSMNHDMMKFSDFLVVKSGTSSLEAGFIGSPFIICYKANYFSYLIGKQIVKIKHIGLPNILLEKRAIPELIQNEVNPRTIHETVMKYLDSPELIKQMKNDLSVLKETLGSLSASDEVSKRIIEILSRKR